MSTRHDDQPARLQCRHILADGRRCRSACLRHEEFCYYHHAARKPVADPAARKGRRATFTLPRIEDRASILLAVNEILTRIAANDIDARRAGRLLYAIQIAACSMPRLAALRPAGEEDAGLVEEVVQHPAYGEIAPRSELALPERDQPRKSLAQELREEMEALEARNIAEFGASAEDDATDTETAEHESGSAPQSVSNLIQLNDMRAELLEAREHLARVKTQLGEARKDTIFAKASAVWHRERQNEAHAELKLLKSATQPQPETLSRLQAVAQAQSVVQSVVQAHPRPHNGFFHLTQPPQIRHSERSSSRFRGERSRRTPRPLTTPTPPEPLRLDRRPCVPSSAEESPNGRQRERSE